MYWTYVWLGVVIVSVVFEAVTSQLVSIWFTGGSIVALILSIFNVNLYIQIAVFIVLSVALMLVFRRFVMKRINKNQDKTNAEAVIGKTYSLLTPIKFNEPGSIKVNGVVWSAVTENEDDEVEEGTVVKVKNIIGNKYIVEVIEK